MRVTIHNATVNKKLGDKGYELIANYVDENGKDRKRYLKLWTAAGLAVGQELTFQADLSARVETYEKDGEKREAMQYHLNNPDLMSDLPF